MATISSGPVQECGRYPRDLCTSIVHRVPVSDADNATRPTSLRALAHPLRSRLLARLRVHGPATATLLAAALDSNTGATSYHLRVLAEAGHVHDTGTGVGRRRVWAAAAHPERSDLAADDVADPDEAAVARWLQHDLVQYVGQRADAWIDLQDDWPRAWRESCGIQDHAVLLTTEQLSALSAELAEVFARYRRIGAGSPGARRVAAYTTLLPVDTKPAR